MSFLGIEIDTAAREARLPEDKIQKATTIITNCLAKQKLTLREIQQVTGILNFACQIIPAGWAFLRRIISLGIGLKQSFYKVRLNSEARKDLQAWLYFFISFQW